MQVAEEQPHLAQQRVGRRFDVFRLLSTYVSGTGLFVSSTLMVWSLYWFVLGLAVFLLNAIGQVRVDGGGEGVADAHRQESAPGARRAAEQGDG